MPEVVTLSYFHNPSKRRPGHPRIVHSVARVAMTKSELEVWLCH